jgi:hypothetical protein
VRHLDCDRDRRQRRPCHRHQSCTQLGKASAMANARSPTILPPALTRQSWCVWLPSQCGRTIGYVRRLYNHTRVKQPAKRRKL